MFQIDIDFAEIYIKAKFRSFITPQATLIKKNVTFQKGKDYLLMNTFYNNTILLSVNRIFLWLV